MQDRVAALEASVTELRSRLAALEARLAAPGAAETPGAGAPVASTEPLLPDVTAMNAVKALAKPAASLPALFGRTSLVLGGAFLIRALTEAGTLPKYVGVAVGITYALALLALGLRQGIGRMDATLHGMTALVIADPLFFEAAVRLGALSHRSALLGLLLFTLLAFTVAGLRALRTLAWAVTCGALATAFALFFESYDLVAAAYFFLVCGMAAAVLKSTRDWGGPRWPLLLAADLLVLEAGLLVARPGGAPEAYSRLDAPAVVACGITIALSTLAWAVSVTLVRKKEPSAFVHIQTLAAFVCGYGAAIHVSTPARAAALAASLLVIGAIAYAVSFTFVERQLGRGRNFFLYASLALLLVLAGTTVLVSPRVLPPLWGALALAAAFVAGRYDRATLRAHAALYLAGAAVVSGLAERSLDALAAAGGGPFPDAGDLTVLALLAACYVLLVAMQRSPDLPALARVPRFAVATLALAAVGATATLGLARLLGGMPLSPPALAVSRTVVLAGSALLLAEAGRRPRYAELGWLVWPLLMVGALKLLVEDLRVGRPATLFPAFVVYGLALWVAPRIAKKRGEAVAEPAQTDTRAAS